MKTKSFDRGLTEGRGWENYLILIMREIHEIHGKVRVGLELLTASSFDGCEPAWCRAAHRVRKPQSGLRASASSRDIVLPGPDHSSPTGSRHYSPPRLWPLLSGPQPELSPGEIDQRSSPAFEQVGAKNTLQGIARCAQF